MVRAVDNLFRGAWLTTVQVSSHTVPDSWFSDSANIILADTDIDVR